MALGSEVHHIVYIVFSEEPVGKFAVADVAAHEDATVVVDVILYSSEISCVCKQVEHYHLYFFILVFAVKQILDVVGADETGSSCY